MRRRVLPILVIACLCSLCLAGYGALADSAGTASSPTEPSRPRPFSPMHSAGPRQAKRVPQTIIPGLHRGLDGLLAHKRAADAVSSTQPSGATGFPVADYADAQGLAQAHERPAIAYNPVDDQYLVVWQADDPDAGWDIHAQRLSADGSPVGQTARVSSAAEDQRSPDVVFNPQSTEYLVVWHDNRSSQRWDIYGQRISRDGSVAGEPIVVASSDNDQGWPRLTANATSGDYLVTWNERDAVSDWDVWARRIDAQGDALGDPFGVTTANDDQTLPVVAYHASRNEYLIIWEANPFYSQSGWDLYGRRLSAAGTLVDYQFTVSSAASDQLLPDLEYDSTTAQYLAVWEDHRGGAAESGIWAQRISGLGTKQGSEITVSAASGRQGAPRVACSAGANGYLVVWEDDPSGSGSPFVRGQRVGTGGQVIGSPLTLTADGLNYQTSMVVEGGNPDGWMVVWQDGRMILGDEIWGQLVNATGGILAADLPIAGAGHGQQEPDIACGGSAGEQMAIWMDYRNGSQYQVFGQRLRSGGSLVGGNVALLSGTYSLGAPRIAYNSTDDEYLIVAHSVQDSSGFDIVGRRVGVDGAPIGELGVLSGSSATGDEGFPSLAYNPLRNESLVAWHAFTAGTWNILGQRVAANGTLQGDGITISDAHHEQSFVSVACNPSDDEYVAVWQDNRDGDQYDIYLRRVSGDGTLPAADIRVSDTVNDDRAPDVVYDRDLNGYLVVWEHPDSTSGSDIHARWVSAAGAPIGPGFAICASPYDQTEARVTYVPASQEYLIIWRDQSLTAGGGDIYAQRLSRQEGLIGTAFAVATADGYQASPALCVRAETAQITAIWQDHRNANWDIFGNALGLPMPVIFLPVVSR